MAAKRFYRTMNKKRADRIRVLYFEHKLKQQEIADIFGITQGSVSRILSCCVWTA